MNAPQLIRIDANGPTIPDHVFEDLALHTLTSNTVIFVLQHPCDRQELQARQQLFRAMEEAVFRAVLHDCRTAVLNYENVKKLFAGAATQLEKHFLGVLLLEAYIGVCQSMASLKGHGERPNQVAEFWFLQQQNELLSHVQNMRSILSDICDFNLVAANPKFVCPARHSTSYYDQICRCAKALTLTVSQHSDHRIEPDKAVSDAVLQLYADQFAQLEALEQRYAAYMELDLSAELESITFLTDIWDLTERMAESHIPYTFPSPSPKKEMIVHQAYDVSLAAQNTGSIVPNNIYFDEDTPFYFLTGANGGGKTSYLRAVGINLLLFLAGCPIFAERARIYPFTVLDTHFPKVESRMNGGRLEEEQRRVTSMLSAAKDTGFLLFNETFSSTDDALGCEMAVQTAKCLSDEKIFGLYVTHFHQVRGRGFPLLQAEVLETAEKGCLRTYRILSEDKDESSFAEDILRKYQLDRKGLKERWANRGGKSSVSGG